MATVKVDSEGNRYWYDSEGRLHRADGPAVEYADGRKEWWFHGDRHREDGPAIERADAREIWRDGRQAPRTMLGLRVRTGGELDYSLTLDDRAPRTGAMDARQSSILSRLWMLASAIGALNAEMNGILRRAGAIGDEGGRNEDLQALADHVSSAIANGKKVVMKDEIALDLSVVNTGTEFDYKLDIDAEDESDRAWVIAIAVGVLNAEGHELREEFADEYDDLMSAMQSISDNITTKTVRNAEAGWVPGGYWGKR